MKTRGSAGVVRYPAPISGPTRTTRVLVVDDEFDVVHELALYLERHGFSCAIAACAEQALVAMRDDPNIAIVVTDVCMGGLDGLTMLKNIRRQVGDERELECIVLTGAPSVDRATEALRLGAVDFLPKPVRPKQLLAAVLSAKERISERFDKERNLRTLTKEKARLRSAFAHYVGSSVVERIEANPGETGRRGQWKVVTFLFTDIADYTQFTEKTEPKQLITILNAYLDGLSNLVLKFGGQVDKFVGDAMVAMFDQVAGGSGSAQQAMECAMALDEFADGFRRRLAEAGTTFGVTRIGVHTGPAFVGKGLESIGVPARRGIGQSIYKLFKRRPDILSSVERALDGDEHTQIFKMRDRLFETVFTCLHAEDGSMTGVLGTSIDVTERHEAQAQLVQAAKLATLGEMATSVAHEINQPLNVIRIASESAIEELEPEDRSDIDAGFLHSKIAQVIKQTERAASIIDHMRIFGRRSDDEPEPFDPRGSVTDALGLIKERFRIHSVALTTNIPDDCRSVLGDQLQLEQVILNILSNAFDAMEESSRKNGKCNEVTIVIEDDTHRDRIRVVCEDTGGGIPEHVLPRIFDPFFTTKEVGKGTGLGLSISYGIVSDMNGSIVADNSEAGARITVELPVAGGVDLAEEGDA